MLRMWIPPVEVDPLESASVLVDITFPLLLKTSAGLLFTGICKYSGCALGWGFHGVFSFIL